MRRLRVTALFLPALFMWSCGSTTSVDPSANDSGVKLDAAVAETGVVTDASVADVAVSTSDASDAATADAGCVSGGSCSTNAGAPCLTGIVTCAANQAQCVDGPPIADGTACTAGLCVLGGCRAPVTVSADLNLSQTAVSPGRTCAEAPQFTVTALSATGATLSAAPAGDCLVSGDEVLLINQQGTTGATANVGQWELLRVQTVQGSAVGFAAAKQKNYGSAVGSDADVGVGAGDQKVTMIRIPRFGELTVAVGKTLSGDGWNGSVGGVLAMRAAKLTVDGTIRPGTGYRSGRWSRDADCASNVATESGESIDGPATVTTANRQGAPGGLSAVNGVSFNGNTPMCAGAGHATAGEAGKNPNGRTLGAPGGTYGVNDATRLTMGSGASGNLTCETNFAGPALVTVGPSTAGGIVALFVDELHVSATGTISATAAPTTRDVSASGGYVLVRGRLLDLGTDRVTALGAVGTSLISSGPFVGQSVKSGDGYVVVEGVTVTGSTKPAFP